MPTQQTGTIVSIGGIPVNEIKELLNQAFPRIESWEIGRSRMTAYEGGGGSGSSTEVMLQLRSVGRWEVTYNEDSAAGAIRVLGTGSSPTDALHSLRSNTSAMRLGLGQVEADIDKIPQEQTW